MERSISPGVKVQTAGRVETTIQATGSWNFFEGGLEKYTNARQAIRRKKEIACTGQSSEGAAWLSARKCVMHDAARSACGVGTIVPAWRRTRFEPHFRPGCSLPSNRWETTRDRRRLPEGFSNPCVALCYSGFMIRAARPTVLNPGRGTT
jgi:hypothetical protein